MPGQALSFDDLPRIVEIYNFAVATRLCSGDLASIALFRKMGFEQWGFMPRVARLEGV